VIDAGNVLVERFTVATARLPDVSNVVVRQLTIAFNCGNGFVPAFDPSVRTSPRTLSSICPSAPSSPFALVSAQGRPPPGMLRTALSGPVKGRTTPVIVVNSSTCWCGEAAAGTVISIASASDILISIGSSALDGLCAAVVQAGGRRRARSDRGVCSRKSVSSAVRPRQSAAWVESRLRTAKAPGWRRDRQCHASWVS
jgi:hypothetical protein